uniref:Protein containing TSGP1 domain n=1 Tax=Rhipicephalus zambeziensis TaxID=60191 RepID=A0A224YEZ0_9ACAR
MLILVICALSLPQALGQYLDTGDCPGSNKIPNQTVGNCNYYCEGEKGWVNTYFPQGTTCHYDKGKLGICLRNEDGQGTSCNLSDDTSEGNGHPTTDGQQPSDENVSPTTPKKRKNTTPKKRKNKKNTTTSTTASPTASKKGKKTKKEKKNKKTKKSRKDVKSTTPLSTEW